VTPTSAAAAQQHQPDDGPQLYSIGQVLARLNPEFPDLSPSKLRFLEERQLITPARTESGYRKFSHVDVERLRFILAVQRDHYLPLKVIRGYLDDLDAGREPQLPGGARVPTSVMPVEKRYDRAELAREAGVSTSLFDDAVAASLVVPAEYYTDETLTVLKALGELQRTGIEPRHLRAFRAAAERELGLIESALMPVTRRRDASTQAKAQELAREIAGQLEVVRSSLIRSALTRIGT
jgi:DNA-binding transcriptional MerR regulator